MKTISKSLEEVWTWKEKCYEEMKGISIVDYLRNIHITSEKLLKENGFVVKDGKLKKSE